MALDLSRQSYGKTATRFCMRLPDEVKRTLESLAPPGLHASAINLAVRVLGAVVSGDATQAADVGERLAKAAGWETEQLRDGLFCVLCAVEQVQYEHDEAREEEKE